LVTNTTTDNSCIEGSIPDSTEGIIWRTIEGIQKLLNPQYGNTAMPEEQAAALTTNNPATQRHFEFQIKTLQDAPRDPDRLRELLQVKQRQYAKSKVVEEIQILVTEIEMLRLVLCVVISRSESKKEEQQ
jgi:predicted type IV restriction endonuclease